MTDFTTLHFIAPFFEQDMPMGKETTLPSLLKNHNIFNIIHLLPILYAKSDEAILSLLPEAESIRSYARQVFLDSFKKTLEEPEIITQDALTKYSYLTLAYWGQHPAISNLLTKSQPPIDWQTICFANSKESIIDLQGDFIETFLPSSIDEIIQKLERSPTCRWIIKAPYQSAGSHNISLLNFPLSKRKVSSIKKLFLKSPRILLQQHLNRFKEFSSQWVIENNKLLFIGGSKNLSDDSGRYYGCQLGINLETEIGKVFFAEHQSYCMSFLKTLMDKGYYGAVGFDSMLYLDAKGETKLLPILEVNARETFASLCFKIQKQYFPNHKILASFKRINESQKAVFPDRIKDIEGRESYFKQNLFLGVEKDLG
ncbi:MAG: hypothetical protein GWP59_04340 [Chlamydiales bacterium]|nr:hypothetical protein [Chlamydiales bacterium]